MLLRLLLQRLLLPLLPKQLLLLLRWRLLLLLLLCQGRGLKRLWGRRRSCWRLRCACARLHRNVNAEVFASVEPRRHDELHGHP